MSTEIDSRLREVIEEFLRQRDGLAPALAENDNLLELGLLDSAEYFDLIALIEERLNLSFDFLDAEPTELVTIAGLSRLASRR